MPDPIQLTARQRQILQFIEHALQRNGAPPTRAEIATEFGFRSANASEEHLRALARKGAIELLNGTARGIRLKGNGARTSGSGAQAGMARLLALPLIGRVAAGQPILAQQHVEQTYELAPQLFTQRPDYLLRVRGESMRDAGIMDGDLLAVRRAQTAQAGQIVVARLDDEVTVKRFFPEPGRTRLRAENPDFADIVVPAGSPLEIEGLAVGLFRGRVG